MHTQYTCSRAHTTLAPNGAQQDPAETLPPPGTAGHQAHHPGLSPRQHLFSGCGPLGVGSGAHTPHGFQNDWHSLRSHHRQRDDRLCHQAQLDGTSAGYRQYRSPHPRVGSRDLGSVVVRSPGIVGNQRNPKSAKDQRWGGLCLALPEPLWSQPLISASPSHGTSGSW